MCTVQYEAEGDRPILGNLASVSPVLAPDNVRDTELVSCSAKGKVIIML
jgi:hypothetical protein